MPIKQKRIIWGIFLFSSTLFGVGLFSISIQPTTAIGLEPEQSAIYNTAATDCDWATEYMKKKTSECLPRSFCFDSMNSEYTTAECDGVREMTGGNTNNINQNRDNYENDSATTSTVTIVWNNLGLTSVISTLVPQSVIDEVMANCANTNPSNAFFPNPTDFNNYKTFGIPKCESPQGNNSNGYVAPEPSPSSNDSIPSYPFTFTDSSNNCADYNSCFQYCHESTSLSAGDIDTCNRAFGGTTLNFKDPESLSGDFENLVEVTWNNLGLHSYVSPEAPADIIEAKKNECADASPEKVFWPNPTDFNDPATAGIPDCSRQEQPDPFPFTFPASGYACSSYESCFEYCATDTLPDGDKNICLKKFQSSSFYESPVEKSGQVTGLVSDQNNKPIVGATVMIFQPEADRFYQTSTNEKGEYNFELAKGEWFLSVRSDDASNPAGRDDREAVIIKRDEQVTRNLRLFRSSSVIKGTIVDTNGNFLDNFYSFVYTKGTDKLAGAGTPVDHGRFSLAVAPGTYQLFLDSSPNSDWLPSLPLSVSVDDNQTVSVVITVRESSAMIIGRVVDTAGRPITNLEAQIFASGENGLWRETAVNNKTGQYELPVSSGRWFLGINFKSTDAPYFQKIDIVVEVGDGETAVQDITVLSGTSTIKGTVLGPDGGPLKEAWISVDTTSFQIEDDFDIEEITKKDESFSIGTSTNETGQFVIRVPAGIYFLHVYLPPEKGLINPGEKRVVVPAGETKEVSLRFSSPDTIITGITSIETEPIEAFVSAWSTDGGYVETKSKTDGRYTLRVKAGVKWRLMAGAKKDDVFYKSPSIAVTSSSTGDIEQNLSLGRFRELPSATTATTDVTEQSIVMMDDGARVSVPPQSLATSGNATITINPNIELPQQGTTQVVGIGYDIEAYNDKGTTITELQNEITITLPYDEIELNKKGLSTDELKIAFWDETIGVWRELEISIVNKDEGVVVATISHLTRFAIVAAADIVPPEAPTNTTAAANLNSITLSWENPKKDFNHARIYRSLIVNKIGDLLVTDLIQPSYNDISIETNTTYYYTIRAVDPAGNESTNVNQVQAATTATSVEPSETPTNLLGRILLQVEDNGEAWYVNPINTQRYFLGRPDDAFNIMRALGLGIANADLNQIQVNLDVPTVGRDTDGDNLTDALEKALGTNENKPDTDNDNFTDYSETLNSYNPLGLGSININQALSNRLTGRILLQVESLGEAWYVNPINTQRYFLGRPDDAFNIMRALGLGISNLNLNAIGIAPDSPPVP